MFTAIRRMINNFFFPFIKTRGLRRDNPPPAPAVVPPSIHDVAAIYPDAVYRTSMAVVDRCDHHHGNPNYIYRSPVTRETA